MNSALPLYQARGLPVFQNRMFDTAEAARASTVGDLCLVRDSATGLVFNQAFRPELVDYDADYQNEQAHSAAFVAHLDQVTAIIRTHFQGQTLIEVGCGKAYFLEHLRAQGFAVTGLDPTYEGDSPHVIKAYFGPETGLKADGLVLRHVLEHVKNPLDFLRQLALANGGQGRIYIEVPCFDWICAQRAWFDIFYEHVNYFRLDDFRRLFGHCLESGRLFGGQYLYVVADLASLRTPVLQGDDFRFPDDFVHSVTRHAETIRNHRAANAEAAPVVVWGGASKGVIFSLFMQREGAAVDYVVDINPDKQGKYLGVTGLRVSSPAEVLAAAPVGTLIFVMNSNYLPEIRAMAGDQFTYYSVDHENL